MRSEPDFDVLVVDVGSAGSALATRLSETDVEGLIGAGRHERAGDRTTYRNGYRERTLDTRLGSLQLRIPKLRQGGVAPVKAAAERRSPQS